MDIIGIIDKRDIIKTSQSKIDLLKMKNDNVYLENVYNILLEQLDKISMVKQ